MSAYYRSLKAGDVATKAALDAREVLGVRKTSTQTVTNSTVNVADSHLTLALAANAVYHVSAVIIFAGPSAANWKQLWTFPAGTTGVRFSHGPATGVTSVRGTTIHARSASLGTSLGYGTDGTENSMLREEILVTTAGTAGNLALTWSQLTANAGGTTVRIGSYMLAEQVA